MTDEMTIGIDLYVSGNNKESEKAMLSVLNGRCALKCNVAGNADPRETEDRSKPNYQNR
jgi:calcineurin-like phosphoesterase family protein